MWFDILIAVILLYSVIRGAAKGIVWQLATIAAIVLCFAFSESFSLAVAPYIAVRPPLNRWIAMFALYIILSFVCFGAARVLREGIEKAKFEEYDRHLGAMFGLAKGVLFSLVLTFFSFTLMERYPAAREAIFNSYAGRGAAILMDRLHPIMPRQLHDVLEPYIHRLDRPDLGLQYSDHDHDDDPRFEDDRTAPFDPSRPSTYDRDITNRGGDPVFDLFPSDGSDSGSLPNFEPPRRGDAPNFEPPTRSDIRPSGGVTDTSSRAAHRRLLEAMGKVYSEDRRQQQAIVGEIERSLAGLPDRVQYAVVEDWHADLLVYDPAQDPDRDTDVSTPLDVRILHQLDRAGVRLDSLDFALRSRLEAARRR